MDRRTWLASLASATAFGQGRSADQLPLANSEDGKRILSVLDEARRTGDVYLEVPVADGRMLRLLTEVAGAKQVVEIGTSTGYSGLWFTLALRKTGGKVTTFELDHERAEQIAHVDEGARGEQLAVCVGKHARDRGEAPNHCHDNDALHSARAIGKQRDRDPPNATVTDTTDTRAPSCLSDGPHSALR